jgi:hypothetical protein
MACRAHGGNKSLSRSAEKPGRIARGGNQQLDTGYQDHHIVGQVARGEPNKGFPDSRIDSSENIVRVPTLRHRAINSWYQSANFDGPYYGQTPREYLRGKGWSERYRVGLDALRRHGVLEP